MRVLLVMVLLVGPAFGQEELRSQIRGIAEGARGRVAVACSLPGTALDCDLNAESRPPMQSVFKLPLAVWVLHEVEEGKLTLDQTVRFRKEDRFVPKAWSPLQDEYPEAEVEVPLRRLLELAVVESDNVAADLLLRVGGGAEPVTAYMRSLGVTGFQLVDGEHAMHRDARLQYRNWITPRSGVELLRRMADRTPLTAEHTALLLGWMEAAVRTRRLALKLPAGTVVAHKTGTSGMEGGTAAATNDIGLITLPDGRRMAIAVFVTDATADDAARDRVIAEIGRAAYEAALRGK